MARIKTSSTPVIRSSTEGRPQFPGWRWGPHGEKQLFQTAAEVPPGWRNRPFPSEQLLGPEEGRRLNRDELKSALREKGVKLDPRWTVTKMEQLLNTEE